jgi:hypothetical protein
MPSSPARERAALNSSSVLHQRRSVLLGMAGASQTRQPVEDCSMRYNRFLTSLESSEERVIMFFMVLSPQYGGARAEGALSGVGRESQANACPELISGKPTDWVTFGMGALLLQVASHLGQCSKQPSGARLDRMGIRAASGRNPPREGRMITHPDSPAWVSSRLVGDAGLKVMQRGEVQRAGLEPGQALGGHGEGSMGWKGLSGGGEVKKWAKPIAFRRSDGTMRLLTRAFI